MTFSLTTRLIAEFLGTAIMVMIGNGSVANVELKGTKGSHSGWIVIAIGYGMAVMIPALMIGKISGNHINPAFTIGLAVVGDVPFILYLCFKPHYDATENPDAILGTFSTTDATNNKFNGFVNEFFGSFILFFCALSITHSPIFEHGNQGAGFIGVGLLVMALVASFGGPTGPALNPARDLGPRILHAILPIKNKGTSQWDYAWVPVLAPICASICACLLYFNIF